MAVQDLRLLARARIDSGELPPCEPATLLGTTGSGARCALCGAPIARGEVQYEVETASRRGSLWRFHIRCHDVWQDVCDELWPRESPAQGQPA